MSNRAAPRSLDENAVTHRLSLVSLIGNALLSAFKLLAGVWGHSGAMISDAIHSFSDVLTTFIAWFGVKVSRRAADASHPYPSFPHVWQQGVCGPGNRGGRQQNAPGSPRRGRAGA